MGLRRPSTTKDYEEMPGANIPDTENGIIRNSTRHSTPPHLGRRDFEMSTTSVSVVPDGELIGGIRSVTESILLFMDFSFSGKPTDTFTVTQAINALGFGWFQVKLSLCVGLCWMADSMEMTILSVLGPALHCDWGITRYQQALTTTVVFLGMMLSSTFWGQLSDRYGRKPVSLSCVRCQWDCAYSIILFVISLFY